MLMKKLIYGIIVGTLIFGIMGCSNSINNKDNKESKDNNNIAVAYEDNENTSGELDKFNANIENEYSEREKNTDIEKLIIDTFEITDDVKKDTKYYYNYIDLNNDGVDELFTYVIGPSTTGTGGSNVFIAEKQNNSWTVKQTLNLINQPIIISDNLENGMKEIIVSNSYVQEGTEPYVKLKYTADGYQSVNEGEAISNLDDIKGVQIISDDLAEDLQSENYLTLE